MLPAGLAEVLAAIDPPPGLAEAAARMSARYRVDGGAAGSVFPQARDRLAYALTRMPATAAAMAAVLRAAGIADVTDVLDLGAGTGAALWAARERCRAGTRFAAVERDAGLVDLARRLAAGTDLEAAAWTACDLAVWAQGAAPQSHDLITAGYCLGELAPEVRDAVVDAAWARCAGWFAIVEPGTPRGAATIAAVRTRLIAAGAPIAAPCPHALACPLAGSGPIAAGPGLPGWCHLSVRLPRSRLHRMIKDGKLGYEDETYCCLVVTRRAVARAPARILAPPQRGNPGIDLVLCRTDGTAGGERIRRSDPRFAAARRAEWGDGWT